MSTRPRMIPKLGSFGAAVWRMGLEPKPIPPCICAVRPHAEIGFVRSKSRGSRRVAIFGLPKSVGKRDLPTSYDQRRQSADFMILKITARNFRIFQKAGRNPPRRRLGLRRRSAGEPSAPWRHTPRNSDETLNTKLLQPASGVRANGRWRKEPIGRSAFPGEEVWKPRAGRTSAGIGRSALVDGGVRAPPGRSLPCQSVGRRQQLGDSSFGAFPPRSSGQALRVRWGLVPPLFDFASLCLASPTAPGISVHEQ